MKPHVLIRCAAVILTVLMAGAGLAGAASAKARRVKAPVTFHLTLSKTEYKRTDPIEATLSLKHNGKKPVWINVRFYVNSPAQPPEEREVWLEVTSPAGEPLSCTFSHPTGFPKSEYFQWLQGGQTATAEHPRDLRSYFTFEKPGRYTVVGVYENVFGGELGLPAFTGPVTSKPVALTIIE